MNIPPQTMTTMRIKFYRWVAHFHLHVNQEIDFAAREIKRCDDKTD